MKILNNQKFIIILFCILSLVTLFSVGIAIYLKHTSNEITSEPSIVQTLETNSEPNNNNIYVEVKGSVKKPGVYQVDDKAIINDVIKMAGGFTKDAWSNNINLSRKITDELVIYVFTKKEYKAFKNNNNTITKTIANSTSECLSNGYLIDNCTEKGNSVVNSSEEIIPEVIDSSEDNNTLVNINSASLAELTTLPGIGDSKAQAIIDYRTNNGLFTSKDDLLNISGISEKTYEKLKELITI